MRPPIEQRRDVQQLDDGLEIEPVLARRALEAEQQIVADGKMRKQAAVLEHIADTAAMHGRDRCRGAVEENAIADDDAPAVGRQPAGDGLHDRSLARAAATEQRRQPLRRER